MQTPLGALPLPVLADNYAWVLHRHGSGGCVVVDPGEADPVAGHLEARGLTLEAVLLTHHHADHQGGVEGLRARWPSARVYASRHDVEARRVPADATPLDEGDPLTVQGEEVRVLSVPGHTLGALAYHLPGPGLLFTGDTLFLAGCGRLFEGSAEQMWASLSRLAELPPTTLVCCGHEYTLSNLRFAAHVEPGSDAIAGRLRRALAARAADEPTVPAPLADEVRTNPFLRCREPVVRAHTGREDPVDVFAALRAEKAAFRA